MSVWQFMNTAPRDGSTFIGWDGKLAYKTRMVAYYEKYPHQEGGPVFGFRWTAEDGDSVFPWNPIKWTPCPENGKQNGPAPDEEQQTQMAEEQDQAPDPIAQAAKTLLDAQAHHFGSNVGQGPVNAAGWAFGKSYQGAMGEPEPVKLGNKIKPILTPTLEVFLHELAQREAE